VNKTLEHVLLLKPRGELRLRHFLARAALYAIPLFVGQRLFMSQNLMANFLAAAFIGAGSAGVEYFFLRSLVA